MQTETRPLTGLQRTARILLKVIGFLLLFIITLFLLILTPPVQRFATSRVENFLEQKLKTKVEIGSISIGLPRRVSLENVYIEDQTKDTLLSGGSIKANVEIFKLLSNELNIKDLQLTDITAKVKRTLPDTAFNFQFIIDAFVKEQTAKTDTAATAVIKLDIDRIGLDNFKVVYQDVVTGNDMFAHVDDLAVIIDSLNPYTPQYDIASIKGKGLKVRFTQVTPLVTPEPIGADIAEATVAPVMKLNIGNVTLDDIFMDYGNDVSAFYTQFSAGHLELDGRNIDLQNRIIQFDKVQLDRGITTIKLGKKAAARAIEKEIEQEVAAQQQANWSFRVDNIAFNNNIFQFDNDNNPAQRYGLDMAHMRGDSLTLHAQNFVVNKDSIAVSITKGTVKEKSGFQLDELQGDLLYASNQSYIKNLYLKTPGTELKRSAILEYASYDALVKNFQQTVMDIDIADSRIQVKDILTFAPQLRTNPAFANPSDIWYVNIVGSGTMERLNIEALQFDGLSDTRIDASGTLSAVTNPQAAGGTFNIRRFHTSQTDLALFTGQRLSTPQINLPETFDASGTLSGNMNNLSTNLNISTSSGGLAVNGRFTDLTDPARATYNATVRTGGLQLGRILRNPQMGALSANITVSGTGFTPDNMNTKFRGAIYSVGFNRYTYRNIKLDGSLRGDDFAVDADIRDPNIDLTVTASGNMTASTFRVNGFVDSIKTLPLHFTTQPLVFRGQVDAAVASINPDYLDGSVLISKALFVSGDQRLPVDSMSLVSGKNDTAQFIRLTSDVANAELIGQYRFADLGFIVQNNIQPYFAIAPSSQVYNVKPYDFTFRADIANSPFLSAFVPGLQLTEPIHAEGRLATGQGLQAAVNTPALIFGTNQIEGLNLTATTTANGLELNGNIAHLKSGDAFNIYNTRINATALNNVITFGLGIDDIAQRNKYFVGGELRQPSAGTYVLSLRPDSLLLNYEQWTVSAGNELIISPTLIGANNFTLQKGAQQLTLQGTNGPLAVSFRDFRLATITGFMKSDSLLADGTMNGTVTFTNLTKQPLFTSDLTIADLSMKQDTIGNVALRVSSTADNRYLTNITLAGRGNDVQVTGSLAPRGTDIALDLDIAVRQLQLNTLEGALAQAVRNATGTINGSVKVSGTTTAPDMTGSLTFNDATFNTVMLGGIFRIDGETLNVEEDGFNFDTFTIRDSANNALVLDGNVQTTNFINYYFNLSVTARNFQALNTTKKDNKIYYGKVVLSTNLYIAGTEAKPIIDGSITIEDKTSLAVVIPQKEPGVAQREGVIQFVDMDAPGSDSLFMSAYDSLNVASLIGFDVAANIEVKKEAVLNLIIDEANGDFLNLQGEAALTAGIDPSGKISLTGSYILEQGAYELSFNFLHRRFEIQKGSSIVWLGEPTRATLDVTGLYIANAAPLDLVASQLEASTTALRNTYFLQKLPFEVYLKVGGELLKPTVSFDIILPEERSYNVSKDVIQVVDTRLSQIRQEPSEMNKQVFSLLLLNRFVGENPFQSSGEGFSVSTFAKQSVSSLLTDQLNSLAGGLVGGVDVNFSIQSSDDYTTGARESRTDLNVGLSKRLLNDRLTVTLGSNFELDGPSNSSQRSNNFAGDLSVNYKLSKDGRYMLRFYRRNEYQGVVEGYIIESGLGFSINVDYDKFREVLRGKKKATVEGIDDKQKPIE